MLECFYKHIDFTYTVIIIDIHFISKVQSIVPISIIDFTYTVVIRNFYRP